MSNFFMAHQEPFGQGTEKGIHLSNLIVVMDYDGVFIPPQQMGGTSIDKRDVFFHWFIREANWKGRNQDSFCQICHLSKSF